VPKPEFLSVTHIETTPEKLWQALTSSDSWTAGFARIPE
jgi:uncharacterized protein YndB with AHSA1/START domain